MELAIWFYNGAAHDLALWIGRNGNAVHSNRAGYCLPIKNPAIAHRFIRRFGMVEIERREDGILYAAGMTPAEIKCAPMVATY